MRHCPSSRTRVKVRDTVDPFERVRTPVASMLATPRTETFTSVCEATSAPAFTDGAVSVSYTRISVSGCQSRADEAVRNRRAVA